MTFGKIKFSELDHLPEVEREVRLRAALESQEIQAFQRHTKKIIGIVFYSTAAIFISMAIFSEMPTWLLGLAFALGTLVTFAATMIVRIQLEVKLVRRILAKTLNSPQNGIV